MTAIEAGMHRIQVNGEMHKIPGGDLLSVPGLRGAGVHCGLKQHGELDLAIVAAEHPWIAAGMFTRNQLPAAPVLLCRGRLAHTPAARAVVINSGNANALTGADGARDAALMAEWTEDLCGGPALVLSTGVIGEPLPMERVEAGIKMAAAALSDDAGAQVAQAMLTTDTCQKICALRVHLGHEVGEPDRWVTVGRVAKGSGMIHPDMATMLCVLATDAPLSADAADLVLRRAVDQSFHQITVDGDTSTNDTVLLLADGEAGATIEIDDPRVGILEEAVCVVASDLARQIVADGEGATRLMELFVTGAADADQARKVARAVTGSLLVKTTLAGGDPNWGRIMAAAGASGTRLLPESMSLTIGEVPVMEDGVLLDADPAALARHFSAAEVRVALDLGLGTAATRMITSDITREYVAINADYHT